MSYMTSINRVLSHEGGYVNHPDDPGGETKYGISKRQYPNEDIANLTRERALTLYRRDYWTPIRGDDMPQAIGFQVLDAAINHGVATAAKWLQACVLVPQDGSIGPVTLAAVNAADPASLVLRFNSIRLGYYTQLQQWPTFGKGWTNRISTNLWFAAVDLHNERTRTCLTAE